MKKGSWGAISSYPFLSPGRVTATATVSRMCDVAKGFVPHGPLRETRMSQVQSVRSVGVRRGYPYYAWGVYEPQARRRDGAVTYRLVCSGAWFRSDVYERHAFRGVPVVHGVRHGTPVPRCDAQ